MTTVFSHPEAHHLSALFMERGRVNIVETDDEHPEGTYRLFTQSLLEEAIICIPY